MPQRNHGPVQRPFDFMGLPVDIRLLIYPFLVAHGKTITSNRQPSVTMVSHQIRDESLPIWYRGNRFLVCLHRGTRDHEMYCHRSLHSVCSGVDLDRHSLYQTSFREVSIRTVVTIIPISCEADTHPHSENYHYTAEYIVTVTVLPRAKQKYIVSIKQGDFGPVLFTYGWKYVKRPFEERIRFLFQATIDAFGDFTFSSACLQGLFRDTVLCIECSGHLEFWHAR